MRRVTARWILTLCVCLVLPATPAFAQRTTLKLATIVPDGSIWDKGLKQMGTEWQTATGGRDTLTVFSGGSQGDEPTVIRKLRLNALQGASLTVVGLAAIDPAFNTFNVPFFFQSYDELNAVVDQLTPVLRQRLEARGYVLLNWGHGGWLQIFSKQPVQTVADLKRVRLYTSAGDDRMTQWYKANGFQPRAMAMTDILTGLSTGMLDAMPTTPLAAMSFQWHKQTPFMLDTGIAPVVGATVIARRAWDAMTPADRTALQDSARRLEAQLRASVPQQDALAVTLMGTQGLKTTKAAGPEWQQMAASLASTMRGQMVPADIFDLALKARDGYRAQHAAAPTRAATPAAPAAGRATAPTTATPRAR